MKDSGLRMQHGQKIPLVGLDDQRIFKSEQTGNDMRIERLKGIRVGYPKNICKSGVPKVDVVIEQAMSRCQHRYTFEEHLELIHISNMRDIPS